MPQFRINRRAPIRRFLMQSFMTSAFFLSIVIDMDYAPSIYSLKWLCVFQSPISPSLWLGNMKYLLDAHILRPREILGDLHNKIDRLKLRTDAIFAGVHLYTSPFHMYRSQYDVPHFNFGVCFFFGLVRNFFQILFFYFIYAFSGDQVSGGFMNFSIFKVGWKFQ